MDNSLRVLSTLALKGAVSRLAGHYEAANGVRIDADFAPTLALLERLRRGEGADLVILTREGLDELGREGRVIAADSVDLARSYVGIAVRGGVAHPDMKPRCGRRCWPRGWPIRGSAPAAFSSRSSSSGWALLPR
jgi:molybdate transport system substrate-binding protein